MVAPAISLAFFDPAAGLSGELRSGVTILYDGAEPSALALGADIEAVTDGYLAKLEQGEARIELRFEPVGNLTAALAASRTRVCRVRGDVGGRMLDCLGTATETDEPPSWDELDALRTISALFDSTHAVLCVARRPRGIPDHGEEAVEAAVLVGDELLTVEDARLSTVYDGDGRQRQASLELWIEGEDLPRRAFGRAAAGTSLDLDGLTVHAGLFEWRMEGREGVGAYDLMTRERPDEAA